MKTILGQSVTELKMKSFRTLTWNSSNNLSDSPSKTFWEIQTNFRKHNFITYLKMKHLVIGLNQFELRCLVDAPGVLQDNLYCDALRAWQTDVPENVLWQRLSWLQKLLDLESWSQNLYFTLNGTITYRISEIRSPIRKFEKYSGYVRNSSQVGSKKASALHVPEPERFEWTPSIEIDFYLFLTVGEFDSGVPGSTIILMKDKSKVRNGKL